MEGGLVGREVLVRKNIITYLSVLPSLPPSLPPALLQLTAEAVYDYSDDGEAAEAAAAEGAAAAAAAAAEQEEGPSPHSFPEGTNLDDDVDLLLPPSSSSASSSLPPPLPPFYTGGRCSSDLFYSEHLDDIHSLLESSGADSYVERMDLEDYLFRFDRGVFWLAQVRSSPFPPPFFRAFG